MLGVPAAAKPAWSHPTTAPLRTIPSVDLESEPTETAPRDGRLFACVGVRRVTTRMPTSVPPGFHDACIRLSEEVLFAGASTQAGRLVLKRHPTTGGQPLGLAATGHVSRGRWPLWSSVCERGSPHSRTGSAITSIMGSSPGSISNASTALTPTGHGRTPKPKRRTSSATIPSRCCSCPPSLARILREIADSKSLKDVSAKTRDAFGLTAEGRGGPANPRVPAAGRRICHSASRAHGRNRRGRKSDRIGHQRVRRLHHDPAGAGARGCRSICGTQNRRRPEPDDRSGEVRGSERSFAPRSRVSCGRAALGIAQGERGSRPVLDQVPALERVPPTVRRWLVKQASVTLTYDGAATLRARHDARDKTLPVMLE